MNNKSLTDFERSENALRWNLEQSIRAYDQLCFAGNGEPRRRIRLLDSVLVTVLKLSKLLVFRAEYEKDFPTKPDWDTEINIADVSRVLALVSDCSAR